MFDFSALRRAFGAATPHATSSAGTAGAIAGVAPARTQPAAPNGPGIGGIMRGLLSQRAPVTTRAPQVAPMLGGAAPSPMTMAHDATTTGAAPAVGSAGTLSPMEQLRSILSARSAAY